MRVVSVVLALIGCQPSSGVDLDPSPDTTTGGTTTGTTTGATTTGGTTTGTTTGTATGNSTTTYDCSTLPAVPVSWDTYHNYSTAEDFDFDGNGFAGALYDTNLTLKNEPGDDTQILSPNVTSEGAGTRVLPTGDWVVANVRNGEMILIDGVTGGKTTLVGGFNYPNGVEVDADNNVYVADQSDQRVIRFNAYDPINDYEVVATGLTAPNGVILSPDDQTLYIGSFGGGKIYAVDRDPYGGWLPHRTLIDNPGGDFGFDGINVDICGNIYFTEWIVGEIRRVTPDGSQVDLVADVPSSWIPNLRWGNDIGGWKRDVLYVSDRDQGRIFGLDMGILGKKHVLAP